MIPRPPTARPGAPAPWAEITPERRGAIDVARVVRNLQAAGQGGIAPAYAPDHPLIRSALPFLPREDPATGITPALPILARSAVLVLVFDVDGEARTLLTRRSETLRAHRGEISFPGGRLDEGETPEAAALREGEEEVGIDRTAARPVGWLRPVGTFSSATLISPVIATLDERPTTRANPAEVDRVFDVALADLVTDGVFHEERWSFPDRDVPGSPDGFLPIRFYEIAGETIWGATARILTELLAIVLETQWDGSAETVT